MKNSTIYKSIFFFIGAFLFITPSIVSASSANISVQPASVTKLTNEVFEITVRVSADENFSGFQANVSTSNLIIDSITLNPNIFLWLPQPSATSLSFGGVITGTAGLPTVDVYTIRARATNSGTATMTISDAIVKLTRTDGNNLIREANPTYTSNGTFSIIRPAGAPASNNNTTRDGQVAGLETKAESCVPSCDNKSCGDDGCGGLCGMCLPGFACSTSYSCKATEDFNEQAFLTSWNNLPNDEFIDIKLDAKNVRLGADGESLSGFRFYGNTNSNAQVHLYIFSNPSAFATTADDLGGWSVYINEPISSGTHKVYAVKMENGVVTRNSEVITLQINAKNKAVYLGDNQQSYQQAADSQVQGVANDNTDYTVVILAVALMVTLLGFVIALIFLKRRKYEYEYEVVE